MYSHKRVYQKHLNNRLRIIPGEAEQGHGTARVLTLIEQLLLPHYSTFSQSLDLSVK